jgi:hypothetical protein
LRGREVLWLRNPRHLLPAAWGRVVAAFNLSRGGMGRGWLPEGGGVNDQPAWMIEAFSILAGEEARIERVREATKA